MSTSTPDNTPSPTLFSLSAVALLCVMVMGQALGTVLILSGVLISRVRKPRPDGLSPPTPESASRQKTQEVH
jgi:hypothetical protein